MIFATQKTLFNMAIPVFGTLLMFAVAALGCGSGLLPSASAMHGGDMECAGMFATDFVVSQREFGSELAFVLLIAALFLLFAWTVVLADQFLPGRQHIHRLLKARTLLLRLHDHLLQLFSRGILHPHVY